MRGLTFHRPCGLFAVLLFFVAGLAGAQDFGMVIRDAFELRGGNDTSFAWTQTATPWFLYNPRDEFSFHLSLDLSLGYIPTKDTTDNNEFDKWRPQVQVNRVGAVWNPVSTVYVELGRVSYEDPLANVAVGLFDGAKALMNLNRNTLEAAVLYTGLQDKERAKVVLTEADLIDFIDEDNYFAARRLLFALSWQARSWGDRENTFDLAALAQVDLRSGSEEKLHSQYAVAKFSIPLFSLVTVSAGGIFGMKQQDSGGAYSFAGNFSATLPMPGGLSDFLSLSAYVSSGVVDRLIRPYFPVTVISAGEIYTPSISGLNMGNLLYQVTLNRSLYLDAVFRYFWRTTSDIIPGIAASSNSDADHLGAEFYISGVWTPLSDLSIMVGTGAFFPDGPVKDAGTPIMWKVDLAATLSL
jgi:hypothetical protein